MPGVFFSLTVLLFEVSYVWPLFFQFQLGFCCVFIDVIEGNINTYLTAVCLIYDEVQYMALVRNIFKTYTQAFCLLRILINRTKPSEHKIKVQSTNLCTSTYFDLEKTVTKIIFAVNKCCSQVDKASHMTIY